MEQPSYDKLCAKVTLQVFNPGSVVFRQGDAGHHAYIVLSGAVSVTVRWRSFLCVRLHIPASRVLIVLYTLVCLGAGDDFRLHARTPAE
jgi:hypothetical protein